MALASRRIFDRRIVSHVLHALPALAFALVGLAFALDFRGLSSNAARRSVWNRGGSERRAAVLTLVQRGIGAVFALVGVIVAVLIIRN
jgi:hypothetical protein